MPNKTKDEEMPWGKDGKTELEKKNLYGEIQMILQAECDM